MDNHFDLQICGLQPPGPGRVLAVAFTRENCASCPRLKRRLDRLDAGAPVDVALIDTALTPEAASVNGIDRVPSLFLVDANGDLIRRWIGEPLAGTLERTVAEHLASRSA